ncbi:hypothetical protein [Amnibacterium kyonggiense]
MPTTPNDLLTADKIAALAASLVGLDLNLAAATHLDLAAEFTEGSTKRVLVRVPGAPAASTRDVGDVTTPLTAGKITEQAIEVLLTDHAYSNVVLSEEDLSLDLVDFGRQVLAPQAHAVSKYIERAVATAMSATPVTTAITYNPAAPARAFTAARRILRSNGLGADARLVAAVGAEIYADLQDAVEATAGVTFDASGKVRGFEVIESTRLAGDEAVFYTPAAFATVVRAPQVPQGAPFGASVRGDTFALRYIRSYDGNVAADRSLVSAFVGVSPMPLPVDEEDGTVSLVEHGGAVRLVRP